MVVLQEECTGPALHFPLRGAVPIATVNTWGEGCVTTGAPGFDAPVVTAFTVRGRVADLPFHRQALGAAEIAARFVHLPHELLHIHAQPFLLLVLLLVLSHQQVALLRKLSEKITVNMTIIE